MKKSLFSRIFDSVMQSALVIILGSCLGNLVDTYLKDIAGQLVFGLVMIAWLTYHIGRAVEIRYFTKDL